MIVLNDYFHNEKKASNGSISVSGKLEAYIGNYFVSGEGILDEKLLLIYYDPEIDNIYDAVECTKENLIACMTVDYQYAFVKIDFLQKFSGDIKEYNTTIIPVSDFETPECKIDETQNVPDFISDIVWIRDDFLSDENIDFDYDAFEQIDSGIDYINPDHFSVNEIIYSVRKTRTNL